MSHLIPLLLLLLAMTSIQFGASQAKGLFPLLGPMGTTTVRLGLASLIMFFFWRPWKERISRQDVLKVILYGASLGGMNFFFFLSLERIPLGIAVALEFIGPLSVAVFASRKKTDYLWAGLAFFGIMLMLPETSPTQALDTWGMGLALLAGVFWGLYIIFGQRAGTSMSGGTAAAWGMVTASLLVAPLGLHALRDTTFTSEVWLKGLMIAILSSAVPYSLEMFALRKLPRKTFGVLMSLEPALGAVMGFFFLTEALSFLQWLAIALVIISSAGSSYTSSGQK